MYRDFPVQWLTVAFLAMYHGLAVSAFFQPFHGRYALIALVLYAWFGFSATFFLHRYLAHRSFETAGWIRTLGFLGIAAGQLGNPAGWAAHHRWHHAHGDAEGDVHSPRHGTLYAYMGWVVRIPPMADEGSPIRPARDVVERHALARLFMQRPVLTLVPHLAVAGLAWALLGFGGMAWCVYVPMVAVYHGAWAVNAFCHTPGFGTRANETRDTSRNSRLLALFTLGDAWHNHHHACPARAAHGQAWHEFDPTAYLIWLLEKAGLVWDVQRGAVVASEPSQAANAA